MCFGNHPPPPNASATPGEFAKEDGDALRRVVLTQVPQMHRVGLPVIQPVSRPEEEARKGVTNYPDGLVGGLPPITPSNRVLTPLPGKNFTIFALL